ncbi:hypothetical protein AOL_s00083g64 [Orbilia oligospora ATCC 24927]|uniref:Uncharacterized protein n=2 Tax=Orbilia oligospora TaxID=2813651 RepID=G1XGD3_ARTOA|nr:hypothetical protein AOL_s00083g64 [Orbilia oligospora ATCC 24927]EGX47556.1 hypothetical protein AOL_s00083g64 [Orbilia oligospora ATCC 24927]KAF3275557.1 hypothetical protein TWF970_006727 [Orbilia oligospora]
MDYEFPVSRAVVARLQTLTYTSYLHASSINNYPKPDQSAQDTVASAEDQHRKTVRQDTRALDQLIRKQEDAIRGLKSQIERLHKREEATREKITLAKTIALKDGSQSYFNELPWLPDDDSGTNTLLTLRNVLKVIEANRKGVTDTERKIEEMKKMVRRERGWVATAQEIEKELDRKIYELEGIDRLPEPSKRREKKEIEAYEKEVNEMRRTSARLTKELQKFVKEKLGAAIAVEEAGGPVIGSKINVSELKNYLDIEAEAGKTGRRTKAVKAKERGQKRLDEIWGDDEGVTISPEEKAGEELLELIEKLVNTMLNDDPHAYTKLTRESAASRYLVRSFVATLHPKDAMRIRLIDFGGKIDAGR